MGQGNTEVREKALALVEHWGSPQGITSIADFKATYDNLRVSAAETHEKRHMSAIDASVGLCIFSCRFARNALRREATTDATNVELQLDVAWLVKRLDPQLVLAREISASARDSF